MRRGRRAAHTLLHRGGHPAAHATPGGGRADTRDIGDRCGRDACAGACRPWAECGQILWPARFMPPGMSNMDDPAVCTRCRLYGTPATLPRGQSARGGGWRGWRGGGGRGSCMGTRRGRGARGRRDCRLSRERYGRHTAGCWWRSAASGFARGAAPLGPVGDHGGTAGPAH